MHNRGWLCILGEAKCRAGDIGTSKMLLYGDLFVQGASPHGPRSTHECQLGSRSPLAATYLICRSTRPDPCASASLTSSCPYTNM